MDSISIKKKKILLLKSYMNRCWIPNCENNKLEFAHIEETDLFGMGRGRKERYYDVIKNYTKYVLLCHDHHNMFDDGLIPKCIFYIMHIIYNVKNNMIENGLMKNGNC